MHLVEAGGKISLAEVCWCTMPRYTVLQVTLTEDPADEERGDEGENCAVCAVFYCVLQSPRSAPV